MLIRKTLWSFFLCISIVLSFVSLVSADIQPEPYSGVAISDAARILVTDQWIFDLLHDLYGWIFDNILGDPDSFITTDRSEYVAGDVVTVQYNIGDYATNASAYLYRVSIYRDVNLTAESHTLTFDQVAKSDTLFWNTSGLFNGPYYFVITKTDRHFPDYSGEYYIPYEYWLVNMTRMNLSGGTYAPIPTPDTAMSGDIP